MLNIDSLNLIKEMKDTEVFVQEQVIEKDDYLDLLSTFPLEQMAREDVHRKIALNKYNSTEMSNFLAKNKPWKEFVDYINSHDFINVVMTFLTHNATNQVNFTKDDLNIGFEFSVLRDGSKVVPHKDKYGKLLSFVFYFVPEDWDKKNKYGGTQFYIPKNKMLNLKIFNDSTEYKNMKLAYEVAPKHNRLLVFKPNHTSWHGVNPIDTEDKYGRPAFIVTVHRKVSLLENFYNLVSPIACKIQKFL